jgi:hypothetical protein
MMPTAAGLALPVARGSPSGRCPLMSRLARSSVIYGSAPKSGAPWADGASPSIRRVHGERSNRRTGEPPGALGSEAWRLRLAAARCFRAKLGRRPTLRRPSPLDAVAKVQARRLSGRDAEAPAPEASWSAGAPRSRCQCIAPGVTAGAAVRGGAPRSGAAPEGPCRAKRTSAAVPRVARPLEKARPGRGGGASLMPEFRGRAGECRHTVDGRARARVRAARVGRRRLADAGGPRPHQRGPRHRS